MCKVMMISGIKPEHVDNTIKFVKAMKDPMSQANTDGLGYAAIDKDGNLFGERWLVNSEAFEKPKKKVVPTKDIKQVEDMLEEKTYQYGNYSSYNSSASSESNKFGEIDMKKMVAITMHTRFATSPRGMINTHPFVENGVSLIHNGVIRNVEDFELRQSTCDSEAILMQYNDNKINLEPGNFQTAVDKLRGYFACGVLAKGADGKPVLDIFKTAGARLHFAYVHDIDNWVITTDDSDISTACRKLGFTHDKVYVIKSEKLFRFDAITGDRLLTLDFKEATYSNVSTYNNPTKTTATTDTKSDDGSGTIVNARTGESKTVYQLHEGTGGKKKNTPISAKMLEFFKHGKPKIERLSEREVEEEIMYMDQIRGGW